MVGNAVAAAGEAVEQQDASNLNTVIASEVLKSDTGRLHGQTCLAVGVPCLSWLSERLSEMRQCFARDSPRSCLLPRKFPHWVLLCSRRI